MRKFISFLVGVLAGAAVGVVVALLLAPSSGAEVQEQIQSRVQELVEEGRRAAAARRAELDSQLEAFKRSKPSAAEVES